MNEENEIKTENQTIAEENVTVADDSQQNSDSLPQENTAETENQQPKVDDAAAETEVSEPVPEEKSDKKKKKKSKKAKSAEEKAAKTENEAETVSENTSAPAEEEKTAEQPVEITDNSETKLAEPAAETVNEEKVDEKSEESNKIEETVATEVPTEKDAVTENITETKTEAEVPASEENQEKSETPATEPAKEKKKIKIRPSFTESYQKLSASVPALFWTCVGTIIFMIIICIAVFFTNVKGYEKVLVPNVIGKNWDEALLELQAKELYGKINLRYSDTPGNQGVILDQNPKPGSIVKGYSRVNLVISRGVVTDQVGDYLGNSLIQVKQDLQKIYEGFTTPLITLDEPEFKPDHSTAGTVLIQDPEPGYSITEPVTVHLVVSLGPTDEVSKKPEIKGKNISEMLETIATTKFIYDFKSHEPLEGETAGTVTYQDTFKKDYISNYTHVAVDMAMTNDTESEDRMGIFEYELQEYPFALPVYIEAIPTEGSPFTLVTMSHSGGKLTVPYSVKKGTTLVLYVADRIETKIVVE